MPLYNFKGKKLLFVHVPKCGGTSLEELFSRVMGKPGLYGPLTGSGFNLQHSHAEMLELILPKSFVDCSVLITRNPFDRIVSIYQWTYKKDIGKPYLIPPFPIWLDYVLLRARRNPMHGNNFIRPQVDFIYPGCDVFKLEKGLQSPVDHIEAQLGINFQYEVGHKYKTNKINNSYLDPLAIRRIREFYREDFEAFGYSDKFEESSAARKVDCIDRDLSRYNMWCKYFLKGGPQKLFYFIKARMN